VILIFEAAMWFSCRTEMALETKFSKF